MSNNNRGFSLVVLVVAVIVIIIISLTATISVKSITENRDISDFMNDLYEVNQYIMEYVSTDGTLPTNDLNNAGVPSVVASIMSVGQIDDADTGNYYKVDLTKLGKIHLADENRGYIFNEGSLKVYVETPIRYKGVDYYTLTSDLTGKNYSAIEPMQISIIGNPVSWTDKAEISVKVNNVADISQINIAWAEGSKNKSFFETQEDVNSLEYGETITLTKNGVYTIYVNDPNSETEVYLRKIVINKIDDVSPKIVKSGDSIIIDDSQMGIKTIKYKIKETHDFAIDIAARKKNPEYYTSRMETDNETSDTLLKMYLGNDEEKGHSIDEYLSDYSQYYKELSVYNRILADGNSQDEEIENAKISIMELNNKYPQFAYGNKSFPDYERNIVIYAEDMNGNATVYSAISREELLKLQYASKNNGLVDSNSVSATFVDAKKVGDYYYTNSTKITLYLQAMHAKYYFITETRNAQPSWKEYKENIEYELSSDTNEIKTLYVFLKDISGKITAVEPVPQIILDTEKPNETAPTVSESYGKISITANQTDFDFIQRQHTKTNLTYRYGIKESNAPEGKYAWYNDVSSIPKLEDTKTYTIITQATDKVGWMQPSNKATITVGEYRVGKKLNIGDWVEYVSDYNGDGFKTQSSDVGVTQTINPDKTTYWRVWEQKDNGDIVITPCYLSDTPSDVKLQLSGSRGYLNGPTFINRACKALYQNRILGVSSDDIRSMTIEDIDGTNDTRKLIWNYREYTNGATKYLNIKTPAYTSGMFYSKYSSELGKNTDMSDSVDASVSPISLMQTYYTSSLTRSDWSNSGNGINYGDILGSTQGWLASSCANAGSDFADLVVRNVSSTYVGGDGCWQSNGSSANNVRVLRPLVTLSAGLHINTSGKTAMQNGTSSTVWKIEK